ncbi:MAG: SMI1/KNR4 family protein [Gammaproteobacteria bacterium]|nr:SMI1/KNR4 family protein [Gammaproteobacteria bacterium]NVK87170.1 SMI1/KNR4 family protein [Gammaproteobacteria bacterium]
MNDIVDELRSRNEDRFGSVELPDMDGLVEIEEQILIPLPVEFKEYLLSVSDVVYGALEPVTASDPQLHTYLPEVAAVAWDGGLPRYLIPVCEYQGGYFAVTQEGEVQYWRGDEQQEDLEWESLWQWIELVWLRGQLP